MELVLDTAIAPFVTKGAVDLFAYRELQKIVKELGQHYQEALVAPVRLQAARYRECLQALTATESSLHELEMLMKRVGH